jgi:hypothetical protein
MNQNYEIFDPGAIAIEGDKIIAVGSEDQILSQYQAKEVIERWSKSTFTWIGQHPHTHSNDLITRLI